MLAVVSLLAGMTESPELVNAQVAFVQGGMTEETECVALLPFPR
jgi:hypothetical protein